MRVYLKLWSCSIRVHELIDITSEIHSQPLSQSGFSPNGKQRQAHFHISSSHESTEKCTSRDRGCDKGLLPIQRGGESVRLCSGGVCGAIRQVYHLLQTAKFICCLDIGVVLVHMHRPLQEDYLLVNERLGQKLEPLEVHMDTTLQEGCLLMDKRLGQKLERLEGNPHKPMQKSPLAAEAQRVCLSFWRPASPAVPIVRDRGLRKLIIQMLWLREKKKGSVRRHTLCSGVFSYGKRDVKSMILSQESSN